MAFFGLPLSSPEFTSATRTFLGTVLVGGAIGGFASTLLPPIGDSPIVTGPLASTFLGALAALLFVVVVSNTDRSDTVRLLAISVVAGITWQPTILGLREAQRNAILNEDIASLAKTVTTLQEIPSFTRPEDEIQKIEYLSTVDAVLDDATESVRNVTTETAQTTASTILTSAFDLYRGGSELVQVSGEVDIDFSPTLHVLPDPQDVELVLTLNDQLTVEEQGNTDVFVRIDIPESARYTVAVTSNEDRADLVAAIHRASDPLPMVINDDAGGSLNPSITEDFPQGEYYLHVRDFYRGPVATFTAVVARAIGDGN